MKQRTNGQSPDRADSWVLMVEAGRVRGGLSSSEQAALVATPNVNRAALQDEFVKMYGVPQQVSYGEGGWGD